MALTPTTDIPLGFKAPEFNLPDVVSGKDICFDDVKGKNGTVVMFICNHCPYVIHVAEQLAQLAKDYEAKGFGFVAINANDVENYPDDSPELMKVFAKTYYFTFPYCFDETQAVAKAYDAACTPDFSVFNADEVCVYRGRLDASRPNSGIPVTGEDLRNALDCLFEGNELPKEQFPSMGCNIKWKTNA